MHRNIYIYLYNTYIPVTGGHALMGPATSPVVLRWKQKHQPRREEVPGLAKPERETADVLLGFFLEYKHQLES